MNLIIEYQYFGNISYYKNLAKFSNIYFEVYENYQKRGFRNKLQLASSAGIQLLSIPILGGREIKKPYLEIKIDYSTYWRKQHIKSIISLYNRSPWFEYYKNELFDLYKETPALLKDWNKMTIEWACKKLSFNVNMAETKSFKIEYPILEFKDSRSITVQEPPDDEHSMIQYNQVFQDKTGFLPNLCILDLLFCEGPNARNCFLNPELENEV